jgi:hypothetical protein
MQASGILTFSFLLMLVREKWFRWRGLEMVKMNSLVSAAWHRLVRESESFIHLLIRLLLFLTFSQHFSRRPDSMVH